MPSTKQPAYSQIEHHNDFDDDDHHHHQNAPRPLGRQRSSFLHRYCCASPWVQGVLNVVLVLTVLALLVERQAPTTWTSSSTTAAYEGSGDVTGFVPPVAQQIKTFVPNMSFAPENASHFFTDEVKDMWLGLVPTGLGYMKVEDPENYSNLPHPLKGYKDTVFTTSVTHQLHCLYNILEVYSSFVSETPIPKQMHGHLPHCFEYLRQSIMCCGDTALEGQHTTFPDGIIGSDGWDAKHVCKDYDAIYSYLEENRVDDQDWI